MYIEKHAVLSLFLNFNYFLPAAKVFAVIKRMSWHYTFGPKHFFSPSITEEKEKEKEEEEEEEGEEEERKEEQGEEKEEEEEKRERNVNCLLGWMKTDERATASGDWRRNQYTKN